MLIGRAWCAAVIAISWALVACREPLPPVVIIPTSGPSVMATPGTPRGAPRATAARQAAAARTVTATPVRSRGTPGAEGARTPTGTPTSGVPGTSDPCRAEGASRTAPRPECPVKGNVGASGERIYHLPGMRAYEDTAIDPARGERWFRSAEEAEAAGWRRAQN